MVEVILTREIPRLGDRGDVVRVANGYARNHLFPKQLAIPATAASRKQVTQMKAAADRESARLKGDAEKILHLIDGLTINIVARAGEADQLFGSVTSRDIAAELEKLGYTVDRHKILIDKPIRMVGEHEVAVHLHRDVDAKLTVQVLAEGREHEPVAAPPDAEPAVAAEAPAADKEKTPPDAATPVKAAAGSPADAEEKDEEE